MKSCAFFGHGDIDYRAYKENIENSIVDLIENYQVTQFYTGGRGAFDIFCAEELVVLKERYPYIKNTLVLSYMPNSDWVLPNRYDDSIYLLEGRVPPKYAIAHTNKLLVDKVDFVVTAVRRSWGGARVFHDYAEKKGKLFKNILHQE